MHAHTLTARTGWNTKDRTCRSLDQCPSWACRRVHRETELRGTHACALERRALSHVRSSACICAWYMLTTRASVLGTQRKGVITRSKLCMHMCMMKLSVLELTGHERKPSRFPVQIKRLGKFYVKFKRRWTENQLGSVSFLASSNANSVTC